MVFSQAAVTILCSSAVFALDYPTLVIYANMQKINLHTRIFWLFKINHYFINGTLDNLSLVGKQQNATNAISYSQIKIMDTFCPLQIKIAVCFMSIHVRIYQSISDFYKNIATKAQNIKIFSTKQLIDMRAFKPLNIGVFWLNFSMSDSHLLF